MTRKINYKIFRRAAPNDTGAGAQKREDRPQAQTADARRREEAAEWRRCEQQDGAGGSHQVESVQIPVLFILAFCLKNIFQLNLLF